MQYEIDRHQDLYGMRLHFKSEKPDGEEGERFHVRATTPWEHRLHLAHQFAARGTPALIPNALGSWFRSLAALKVAGVKKATIMIPDSQNFLTSPVRTAVVVNEVQAIFLPVYKCGTSSFRALAHEHFAEFANRDASSSISLNSQIDPRDSRYDNYNKFTFVREPMDRFGSFYRDKLMVDPGTANDEHFANPIRILMESKITAKSVANFIASIPPEFCDPHFKPQWLTLTYQGELLADTIFHLGDNERLEEIGINHALPKRLSTQNRETDYKMDKTLHDAKEIVRNYYNNDYRLWNENYKGRTNDSK